MRLIILSLGLILSFSAFAFFGSNDSSKELDEEAKIREIAKKRLYPGGQLEQDLKVSNQVYVPERKIANKKSTKENEAQED